MAAKKIPYFASPKIVRFAVPIEGLKLDPKNEKIHHRGNIETIKASLRRFGWRELVHIRAADGGASTVTRGNGTLVAARELAEAAASDDPEVRATATLFPAYYLDEDTPVVVNGYDASDWERGTDYEIEVDWRLAPAIDYDDDDQVAAAWRVTHNRSSEKDVEWSEPALGRTFAEHEGIDWGELGWADEDLDRMLEAGRMFEEPDGAGSDPGPPEDPPIPEPPADPETQPGDIWHLGEHRLICGDCRDPEVVARLLDGEVINVAFTSPPYASQRKYDPASGFKPIPPDDYVEWFEAVQANVRAHLAEDGSWFVNIKEHCEDGERHLYVKDLTIAHKRRWGWRYVDELCWRRTGIPGRHPARFKNSFEPVFHFTTQTKIKFDPWTVAHESTRCIDPGADKHAQRADERTYDLSGQNNTTGLALPSNVLDIAQVSTDVGHSAVFPIGLPTFFVKAYSDPGDRVFDPFMGSGTVIITCEREGRIGYGCEVSRGYCDVIVMRWEAETGLEAQLERDGEIVAHEFPAVEVQPRKPGKRRKAPEDGNKTQARRRVQTLIQSGKLKRPADVTCVDCKAVPAREYDHHLGYGAEHHEDVEALCAKCHHAREAGRI